MFKSDESSLFAPISERSPLVRWLKRRIPNPRLAFRSRESRKQFRIFLQRVREHPDGMLLNIGSKSVDLGPDVVNLDMRAFPNIHVLGDGHHLPFQDESLDGMIITSVLEHVANPRLIVREIWRVLRTGGELYVEVPFLRPFHPDPEDFRRYSLTGLQQLFGDFAIRNRGMCVGPSSGLASVLSQYMAILVCFNNRHLYKVLARLFRFIFIPLTYVDIPLERVRYSLALASSYFLVCLKGSSDNKTGAQQAQEMRQKTIKKQR